MSTKSRMTSRAGRRLVRGAAVCLVSLAVLSGCSLLPKQEDTLAPPLIKPSQEQVDTVEAKTGTIQSVLSGTASVASNKNIPAFYKEWGGRVKAITAGLGDKVKAGQAIAELDSGDLDTRIAVQRLNVEKASINLHRLKNTAADQRDIRLSEIDLEKERISLESLEQQLEGMVLTAPISGVVSYVDQLSPGDTITGYKPVVVISDPASLYLVYESEDSKQLSAVQNNMAVEVTVGGSKLKGKVIQAPSNAPFTDNEEETARNSKTLYMSFERGDQAIEMGQTVEFTIVLARRDNVIVIPRNGLRTYLGRTYVQVQDGERRKEVDVQPGITTQTEVEIAKGLSPGQKVILNN